MKWTPRNKTAFRNWFGLYCDQCVGIIPCLRNLTTLVMLGVTFPFWLPFVKSWKRKWLAVQKQKFSKTLDLTSPAFNWVSVGLGWGCFMFLFIDVIPPFFNGDGHSPAKLALGFVIWLLGGLLFGFIVKKFTFTPARNVSSDKPQQAG